MKLSPGARSSLRAGSESSSKQRLTKGCERCCVRGRKGAIEPFGPEAGASSLDEEKDDDDMDETGRDEGVAVIPMLVMAAAAE
jgi:hypothetical protein